MTQYIYMIKCREMYKIGVANDVESRLASLQTGNPYPLAVVRIFSFENAEFVERAIHQRYSKERGIGEWFKLEGDVEKEFSSICLILGGVPQNGQLPLTNDFIEQAEEIAESPNEGAKWDFRAMFSDNWRIETHNEGKNWRWRRGSGSKRECIPGGRTIDLLMTIDELRKKYGNKEGE